MDYTSIMEITASMGAAIGGWEFIKYMLNIHTNKRKERSEADKAKAEAVEDMIAEGVLEEAREYAVRVITQFMLALGFEEVKIK